jgi:hypothetical protein
MTLGASSDNNAVEVDGVRFKTILSNPVLSIPVKKANSNGYTSVELGMKITNATPNPLYFSGYTTLIPKLLEPGGKIKEWGRNSNILITPSESNYLLAMPGESVTFFPDTILLHKGNYTGLAIEYGDGSVWVAGELKPGKYQFRFSYQKIFYPRGKIISRPQEIEQNLLEQVWFGKVDAPFVELHLVKP